MVPVESDTVMIVAGGVFSLLALIEIYSSWKRTRDGPPA